MTIDSNSTAPSHRPAALSSGALRPIVPIGSTSGPEPPFPLYISGPVIKGFGRGSKELQIPTANIPVEGLSVGGCETVESGVYFGWAGLNFDGVKGEGDASEEASEILKAKEKGDHVYPMVMSIGWNPFYKNTVRSVEVHLLHIFAGDFYGAQMKLAILGYIRPELDYVSKEALIADIKTDIEIAKASLERETWDRGRWAEKVKI
ncbi:hypothetical protein BDZ91DRAFT_708972 [Kalaharituber pfeilii]|nr:hypothetical protein BDZ91DRAFT_708972 [Kalaharituber pfeilii]